MPDREQNVLDAAQAQPTIAQPKVNWDDSQLQSTYSNVCNVMGTREEIAFLFGSNQSWQTDQAEVKEVNIKLSNRILLTPHAAKRFSTLLQLGLKQYEDKFGEIKL